MCTRRLITPSQHLIQALLSGEIRTVQVRQQDTDKTCSHGRGLMKGQGHSSLILNLELYKSTPVSSPLATSSMGTGSGTLPVVPGSTPPAAPASGQWVLDMLSDDAPMRIVSGGKGLLADRATRQILPTVARSPSKNAELSCCIGSLSLGSF